MKLKKQQLIIAVLATVAFVASLVLATFWDLQINTALHNPNSTFGLFFADYGELFAYLPLPFLFSIFLAYVLKAKPKYYYLLASAFVLLALVGWYLVLNKFVFDQFFKQIWFGWVVITTFPLQAFTMWWFHKLPKQTLQKLLLVAAVWLLAILVTALLTQGIKLLWGRVRFRHLESVNQFTPWYVINGYNGNLSFVSGHTSAATAVFGLLLLEPFLKVKKCKPFIFCFAVLWVVCVALSRIVLGAHYLSDVLFGATLGILVFFVVHKLVHKVTKQKGE